MVIIGSVHARRAKPRFAGHATTKANMHGLTQASAVELSREMMVICVATAAANTPMLAAWFRDDPNGLANLEAVHPVGRKRWPEEVAKAAAWPASDEASFVTGSALWIDGGITSLLHDPV